MWTTRLLYPSLVGLLTAASAIAQEPDHSAHTAPALGSVNFRNSGNTAAQIPLQRGVAWLHNFKYIEAAESFQEAQRADPGLAVAYWLEALTYSHVLWRAENLPRAREALTHLAPTRDERLAKAKSPRERAFGAAVEAFFANGSLAARTIAYSDSLEVLARSDSTDLEAAAFSSHAALMANQSGTAEQKPRLAALARTQALRVFKANPNHPGAAHYLTHMADVDPASAEELLPFAKAYDKIAPDADHALHMPSHVYLPLGLWRETSSANERAWAASRSDVKSTKESQAMLSWHSLEWLQYAYLQEGRWSAARALVDTARLALEGVEIGPGNADARFAVDVLAFNYGMETGDWSAWPGKPGDIAKTFRMPVPTQRAFGMTITDAYEGALVAIFTGRDTAAARASARTLRAVADTVPPEAVPGSLRRAADQIDALLAGDGPRGLDMLAKAGQGEVASASVPPLRIPTQELVGAALLKANRPTEAAAAYRASLVQRSNRSSALLGLLRASRAAGDNADAEEAYRRLADNWKRADPRVLKLLEAEKPR